MTSPDRITTRTAAVILGTTTRTVTRMVVRGDLAPVETIPVTHHGVYIFDRATVEALAERKAAKA